MNRAPDAAIAELSAPRLPTVSEAVSAYLADCQIRSLRATTVRSRRIRLGHLEQHGGGRRRLGGESLDTIPPLLLDAFRAVRMNRSGEPVRPATARKEPEYL